MLWILLAVGFMGSFIIAISILIGILFISDIKWRDVRDYAIKNVIFIVIVAVGLIGLGIIDDLSYEEVAETGNWKLLSLSDSSQISGKGSGGLFYVYVSIDTDEVYSFYYQVNDDGFKRGKVDADATIIYEKEDCVPHIVEYTTYTKNKMNSTLRMILAFGYGESSQKTYEIYIPTGTIFRTFSLDSQ